MRYSILSLGLLSLSPLVAGHSAIIKATGDMGGMGSAIGVVKDTPRDGTRRDPFQQDATRFKGQNKATCGQTVGAGENDINAGTKAVMADMGNTLPQVSQGGEVQMTLHQVNGDGAGPYACQVDATGTGANFVDMQVTQNVPGKRGNDRDGAKTDFPLKATMPAGMTCSGNVAGQANACVVRCMNQARAGPFGGCVPVQMVNAAAGNGTAAAKLRRAPRKEKVAEDLENDPEFLAELRADGEEI
ncbi:CAS1 protein [Aulographum hederae CBS 113979]|uniref:CAS1 protein n=1 Tax=Aulographum hederae CBS 113979 TaxID=1176131 RepID=A0A6G1H7J4_9PEZI|nr:CAS1 protein [Aulographum hederae CBS 113979]